MARLQPASTIAFILFLAFTIWSPILTLKASTSKTKIPIPVDVKVKVEKGKKINITMTIPLETPMTSGIEYILKSSIKPAPTFIQCEVKPGEIAIIKVIAPFKGHSPNVKINLRAILQALSYKDDQLIGLMLVALPKTIPKGFFYELKVKPSTITLEEFQLVKVSELKQVEIQFDVNILGVIIPLILAVIAFLIQILILKRMIIRVRLIAEASLEERISRLKKVGYNYVYTLLLWIAFIVVPSMFMNMPPIFLFTLGRDLAPYLTYLFSTMGILMFIAGKYIYEAEKILRGIRLERRGVVFTVTSMLAPIIVLFAGLVVLIKLNILSRITSQILAKISSALIILLNQLHISPSQSTLNTLVRFAIDFTIGFILGFLIIIPVEYIMLTIYVKAMGRKASSKISNLCKSIIEKAGIKRLSGIYIVPTFGGKMANAFVYGYIKPTIALTDALIEYFNEDEIQAIIAHEIAHVKLKHITLIQIAALILGPAIFLSIFTVFTKAFSNVNIAFYLASFIIAYIAYNILIALFKRRKEREADIEAVRLCGKPKSMIKALVKLAYINFIPMKCKKIEEAFETHPPILKRIKTLANIYGISEDELEKIRLEAIEEAYRIFKERLEKK